MDWYSNNIKSKGVGLCWLFDYEPEDKRMLANKNQNQFENRYLSGPRYCKHVGIKCKAYNGILKELQTGK